LEGPFVLWTEAAPDREQWLTAELVLTDGEAKGMNRARKLLYALSHTINS